MDYIEGLYLGKLWSDTDFENRRHVGLFILYGIFVDAILLYRYFTGTALLDAGNFGLWQKILLVVLFVACPFICFRYYRMPLWGKLLVLFEKTVKVYLIVSLTISLVLPYITVQYDGLQEFAINYLNGTLETYTQKFAADAGSFATVMGVLAGGIHVILVFVLAIAAAVVVPGIIFILIRLVQYAYDFVLDRLVLKRFFRYKR